MKPQLSLFDNNKCTQCDKPIKEGYVYCKGCAKAWVEKYLNPKQLDQKSE